MIIKESDQKIKQLVSELSEMDKKLKERNKEISEWKKKKETAVPDASKEV